MRLNKALPFAAVTFVVAGLASMGMPGFSGFVAEMQVLIGAWTAFPTFAVLAGAGILVGVAYTLRAVQKAFYPESAETVRAVVAEVPIGPAFSLHSTKGGSDPVANPGDHEPITIPERIGAALLIAATVLIGLQPRLLLDLIVPAIQSPLFDGLRKVAG